MKYKNYIYFAFFVILCGLVIYACETGFSQKYNTRNDDNKVAGVRPQLDSTSVRYSKDGVIAYYSTGKSLFPESDPWINPPGTNLLPNIFTNMLDTFGNEMVNTLPSTPTVPYNLHDGIPVVTNIDKTSPTDDLHRIIYSLQDLLVKGKATNEMINELNSAIDILEGNDIVDRVYSGFPLLHYNGPEKVKAVEPIYVENKKGGKEIIGGNVDVTQLWYDSHIESDVAMLDLSAVMDVPWTITYSVNVLNRGEDDFSPFAMFWDRDNRSPDKKAHVAMDQTFFPMQDGTQTIFKIKMPPAKYYNLVYTWGWRMHPPRIQVIEDRNKHFVDPSDGKNTRLDSIEIKIFGPNPTKDRASKDYAISKISDLSPAKIMWRAFKDTKENISARNLTSARENVNKALDAFNAWKDRTHLPNPELMDTTADLTLLYVNNTIYGGFTDGGTIDFPKWRLRGDSVKVTIKNGDYFWHNYQNVDFGGARGWENLYKSAVRVGGSGCWFTFGRVYWWKNLGKHFLRLPEADMANPLQPTIRKAHITFNFEPSRRLRFYQFDPMHHDVCIFSVH